MPKEKPFNALCLLIDVGSTSSQSGYADSAFKLASEMVQWKLYAESTDCFGIVLLGSKGTDNPLGLKNVTIANYNNGCLSVSDFSILEYLERHIKQEKSDVLVDWANGVDVAIDFLKRSTVHSDAVGEKKIVLISDLGCPSENARYDEILEEMKRERIELVLFHPDWDEARENEDQEPRPSTSNGGDHKKPMSHHQLENFELVKNLVDATDGLNCDISTAMSNMMNKERRKKKPFPWKVDLQVGPDIRINITGYIKVRREAPKTWKRCLATDEEAHEVRPDVTYVRNNEDQEVVEREDLVESYKYGSELIAVSDVDKENAYHGGEKSMIVVGFITREQIPYQYLLGDGSMVFLPTEGDPRSLSSLSALVNAMNEDNVVAVVRRVYRAGTAPKLGVLIPEEDVDLNSGTTRTVLAFIELPFMEDIRSYFFAPLWNDTVKPSDDQLQAVDGLIDSMLVKGDQLPTSSTLNPYYQHLYKCLTYRALNPGKILPDMSEHAKSIMAQPEEITKTAEKPLEAIAKLFKLELVLAKKPKVTGESAFGEIRKRGSDSQEENSAKRAKEDLSLSSSFSVTNVGTTTPVEDFKHLIKLGFQFNAVVVQLEKVILDLLRLSFGNSMNEKIVDCVKVYRETSLELKNAGHFNQFMAELKENLVSDKKDALWKRMVVDENQGLILLSEDPSSSVTKAEGDEFLKFDLASKANNGSSGAERNDDDLLDDL